jgi:hypothetical protein
MEFVLLGVDVVFQVNLNLVIHLRINILAQASTDDRDPLHSVSPNPRQNHTE